jgi:homoserine/homoserine lactone efflux protein
VTLDAWLLFCATEIVLSFTPGPAVLLVVSLALTRGARDGRDGILGILGANAGYFALSATGVGALLLASFTTFFLVKWIGAAYLCWIGLRMLLAPPAHPDLGPGHAEPSRARSALALGFLTQGANPKALAFFAALLPQFVDPERPVASQLAVLGFTSLAIEAVVLVLYLLAGARLRRVAAREAYATKLHRAGGALLIGAGAGLAALRRA